MTDEQTEAVCDLLDAICEIVEIEGTWQQKKKMLLETAGDHGRIAIEEFLAWFDEETPHEEN